MPLEDAPRDLAAHGGKVRSHRFLGGNAALAHLRGDADAEAREAAFLRGAVSIAIEPVGQRIVDVVLRNRRVGHRFPGGTNDSNEVWIEVAALDGAGRVIAISGALDDAGALDPSAHLVRAQPVDGAGQPLARRDVQHMRGIAWDTSLAPGEPQAVRYALPEGARSVRARLVYRKFERGYLAFACARIPAGAARAACEGAPAVEVSRAEAPVEGAPEPDLERLIDHGLALAGALVDRAWEASPALARAAELAPARIEPWLGLAKVDAASGRTDEALTRLDAIEDRFGPSLPALWLRSTALHAAYRNRAARAAIERLAALLPDDRPTLGMLARLRGLDGDAAGAIAAADRQLAIDPEAEEGLYQRSLALAALGAPAPARAAAEAAWLRHRRRTEDDLALRRRFEDRHPERRDESVPLHVHQLGPVGR